MVKGEAEFRVERQDAGKVRLGRGRVQLDFSGLPDLQLTKLGLTLWGDIEGFSPTCATFAVGRNTPLPGFPHRWARPGCKECPLEVLAGPRTAASGVADK
jgi:hypothetical protein